MTSKQIREQVKSRIGDLIQDNMELCGLTPRDLIKELGIEHAHLSAWLTGRHLPSLPAALAMAQVFGVTVEQLALGDDAGTGDIGYHKRDNTGELEDEK